MGIEYLYNILVHNVLWKQNKMKNKTKYHRVGTIRKSNIKIIERGQIDAHKTQMHDCSFSWLGTDTSIKIG